MRSSDERRFTSFLQGCPDRVTPARSMSLLRFGRAGTRAKYYHYLCMSEEPRNGPVGDLAARCKAQAAQARAQARLTSRQQVRRLLLRHADTLEELARQAEQAGEADASRRRLRR